MNIQAVATSDVGQQREGNEDQYLIDESLGLYIVCDGMGGHAAGEVAAERSVAFAAEYIRDRRHLLDEAADSPDGYFRVLELAEDATQEASLRLHELACTGPDRAGMGTTMTLLLVVDNKAVMAHVGDSRLYMLRGGDVHQLSTDHTLANELLLEGGLTPEEAAASNYHHVLTRVIGQQERVQAESLLFDLFDGDTCLLCSDGLSNYFDDRATVAQFLAQDDLSAAADQLVEFANSHGGSDNITLVVLRATSDRPPTESEDIQHRLDTLKSTFLCRKFSASRLMRMLNITTTVECSAGQRVFAAGQEIDGLYIVLDGRFEIDDDMLLADDFPPGSCVGESALVRPGKIHTGLVAAEPSRLLRVPRSQFTKLTRRLPKLGNALLRNLSRHLSEELDAARRRRDDNLEDTGIWETRDS